MNYLKINRGKGIFHVIEVTTVMEFFTDISTTVMKCTNRYLSIDTLLGEVTPPFENVYPSF